jgi:voltage-gated potassium channel
MIAEKIKQDRTTRYIALVPFHDRLLREAAETTLRVILEVLADPRTDELVSDVLRDNMNQIRDAVREHDS